MARRASGTSDGWWDQFTRGLTAGIGARDIRAMLRGEPPSEKPNPRARAHTESMLLHVRPRFYLKASTQFTHTFRLGFFTTLLFFIEVITGLVLMVYYVPTPEGAYPSIIRLMTRAPFGELMRDIHRLAAEGMILFAALHMLRTFLTSSYKNERAFTWLTGVLLLLLTLFLTFSGYLLPWDQLAYWAVTIGTGLAAAVPVVGQDLLTLLRGSATIGADGLLRFYLLHVLLLPLLTGALLSVHYYRVARKHSISLPVRVEQGDLPPAEQVDATRRIPFLPDLLTHELFLMCLGLLALIVCSLFFYDAPLEHHADPEHTPFHAQAPWFFLWVQGLLKLGDVTLLGIGVPLALTLLLLILPYLVRGDRRPLRQRPWAILFAGAGTGALLVLTYIGTPQYGIVMPAATQISQNLAPEEGRGPLHQVPFGDLEVGVYEVGRTDEKALNPGLQPVFRQFASEIGQAGREGRLSDAEGLLIVQDWQAGLKRVTMRIAWTDPEDGRRHSYERDVFLHQGREPDITAGQGEAE